MRALLTLALVVLAGVSVAGAWFYRDNPLTLQAQDYAEGVAATSAATYVTLRSLNAFLSTAQEVEVGGSFVVSGTAQPLKVLEPIDDTVERVADMVFAVMLVTGVLAVALGPVGAVGFAMIAVACVVWALEHGVRERGAISGMSRGLFGYGAFLALALPLAFVIAAQISDSLTDVVWARNSAILADIATNLDTELSEETGSFAAIGGSFRKIEQYQEFAGNVWSRADELVQSFVMILAVFAFKIAVLPVMLLGAFLVIARYFAVPGYSSIVQQARRRPRRRAYVAAPD